MASKRQAWTQSPKPAQPEVAVAVQGHLHGFVAVGGTGLGIDLMVVPAAAAADESNGGLELGQIMVGILDDLLAAGDGAGHAAHALLIVDDGAVVHDGDGSSGHASAQSPQPIQLWPHRRRATSSSSWLEQGTKLEASSGTMWTSFWGQTSAQAPQPLHLDLSRCTLPCSMVSAPKVQASTQEPEPTHPYVHSPARKPLFTASSQEA